MEKGSPTPSPQQSHRGSVDDTGKNPAHQVAIVTGASRGIGRATAVALAREGLHLIVNFNRDQVGAEKTRQLIAQSNGRSTLVQANVGDMDHCRRLVEEAKRNGRITVLVNNAAAFSREHFFNVPMAEFDRIFDVNVRGVYYLSQLVSQHMADHTGGSIVHISSILAQQAIPTRTLYCASKGALEALTRAMALDLAAYGVRVNAVIPGLIETKAMLNGFPNENALNDMRNHIPVNRFGRPEELANAVCFIASEAASYINGTTLLVDGGLGAREAGPVLP